MKSMKFKIPNHLNSIIIFGIMIIYSSCGFQGRKYTTGLYWESEDKIEYDQEIKKPKHSVKNDECPHQNSIQSKEFIEVNSIVDKGELDTLKIPLYRKKKEEVESDLIASADSITPELQIKKQKAQRKINRAQKGLKISLGLEGFSVIGLVVSILDIFQIGTDAWGFNEWVILFILLIPLFLISIIAYTIVYLIRKRRFRKKYGPKH